MEQSMVEQLEALKGYLAEKKQLAVGFSGGVDSAFLLKVAHDVLGENVVAVTAKVRSLPKRELDIAREFCRKEGIPHSIVEVDELEIKGFAENPIDRCYICKKVLFGKICEEAARQGMPYIAEASNLDDNGDYRPGLRAVEELGVLSPLRETGIDKKTIRALAKELGILVWNKPSFACLATRFVYGEQITAEKLAMVDAAEQFLAERRFRQVRVRVHGADAAHLLARIEFGEEDFFKALSVPMCRRIQEKLKEIGFAFVTLDLGGYRMGSMNDGIEKDEGRAP